MSRGRPKVVVTGLGAVSPIGVGVRAYTRGLRTGRSGVGLLGFRHEKMRSSVAAVCAEFDPLSVLAEAELRRVPRLVPMALAAAREAMEQAGLGRANGEATRREHMRSDGIATTRGANGAGVEHEALTLPSPARAGEGARSRASDFDRGRPIEGPGDFAAKARLIAGVNHQESDTARRVGLVLGTGGGGIDFTLEQYAGSYEGRRASLWTITNATHGNLAGELSIQLGLKGPSLCVSTGCASSSDAAGMALEMLRSERVGAPRAMVVVGADAHVKWEILHTMELLGVISTRDFRGNGEEAGTASRPFDQTRDGFVLGEGAWAMVLEREEFARERGLGDAAFIGELMGYGVTCDAYHRVRPDPEMSECVRAMREAMADAGVSEDELEVVQYHGTGTQLNDALETAVVKRALGDERARRVIGSSVKSQIGHPQGACGMAAVVATLASLTGQDGGGAFVPATINLRERDPACDLEYGGAAETKARVALVNCLAFGAKNSALVVRAGLADS